MSRILILGGSVAGLVSGMQLARRHHHVTILERDARARVAVASEAPEAPRIGAPHAVQGHSLLARAAVELRQSLPDVYTALLAAGVGEIDLVAAMPVTISDRIARAGDEQLTMLATRRRTLDRVLVETAEATPGLELRFETSAVSLLIEVESKSPPRVVGVVTGTGEPLLADVVIDASGRRTQVPDWLASIGVNVPVEAWDCGLVYYTRHFQVRPGVAQPPLNRIFAAGEDLPSLAIRWFPGDNDTAMLVITVLAEDHLLKEVRHPAFFERVSRAIPSIEPWLGCADPITEVFAMGALQNTLRRFVHTGQPLVLGLHVIGDAACTTNPTMGRGISLALISTAQLVQSLTEMPDDLASQSRLLDEAIAHEIEPRFRENARYDRSLANRLRADLAGQTTPPPPSDRTLGMGELLRAGRQDADLYRVSMRHMQLLSDWSVLSDPALTERVRRVIAQDATPAPLPKGPDRRDLERMLGSP